MVLERNDSLKTRLNLFVERVPTHIVRVVADVARVEHVHERVWPEIDRRTVQSEIVCFRQIRG